MLQEYGVPILGKNKKEELIEKICCILKQERSGYSPLQILSATNQCSKKLSSSLRSEVDENTSLYFPSSIKPISNPKLWTPYYVGNSKPPYYLNYDFNTPLTRNLNRNISSFQKEITSNFDKENVNNIQNNPSYFYQPEEIDITEEEREGLPTPTIEIDYEQEELLTHQVINQSDITNDAMPLSPHPTTSSNSWLSYSPEGPEPFPITNTSKTRLIHLPSPYLSPSPQLSFNQTLHFYFTPRSKEKEEAPSSLLSNSNLTLQEIQELTSIHTPSFSPMQESRTNSNINSKTPIFKHLTKKDPTINSSHIKIHERITETEQNQTLEISKSIHNRELENENKIDAPKQYKQDLGIGVETWLSTCQEEENRKVGRGSHKVKQERNRDVEKIDKRSEEENLEAELALNLEDLSFNSNSSSNLNFTSKFNPTFDSNSHLKFHVGSVSNTKSKSKWKHSKSSSSKISVNHLQKKQLEPSVEYLSLLDPKSLPALKIKDSKVQIHFHLATNNK